MLAVVHAVPRMDDRDRHAVSGVDLGQLDAGWTTAQHDHAVGEVPGGGSLLVGPVLEPVQPGQRRNLGERPDSQDHVLRVEALRFPGAGRRG